MNKFAVFCLLTLGVAGCAKTLDEVVSENGFARARPASTGYGPGNLILRGSGSDDKRIILGGYVCDPGYVKFPPTLKSRTESYSNVSGFEGEVSAPLKFMNAIGLQLTAKFARSATVKFENVEIVEYALEDLRAIVDSLGPVCKSLLRTYKDRAVQVFRALKINYSYEVEFKPELTAAIEQSIIKEIGKVTASAKVSQNKTTIKGEGLYYGIVVVSPAG